MNDKTNSSPEVLEKLVGRSGGVLHVGIVQNSKPVHKLATIFYKCSIRNSNSMLFAIPLEMACEDRTIYNGANVFDIAIQGYFSGTADILQRNFEYIFGMSKLRTEEFASRLSPTAAGDFKKVSEQWLTWIKTLPENDLADNSSEYERFDATFINTLGVRILLASGEVKKDEIILGAIHASQWLSNYVKRK